MPMSGCLKWLKVLLLVCCLWGGASRLSAADNSEARNLFQASSLMFQDGAYDQAERSLARFLSQFPNSVRIGEAALLQSRALFELKRYDDSLVVIAQYQGKAGSLGDQYQHLKARNHWGKKDYSAAAKDWRELVDKYPKSPLYAEAIYSEALAYREGKAYAKVVELLSNENSAYGKLNSAKPNDDFVIRGQLLLAECLLELKRYPQAEQMLVLLADRNLSPVQAWQRVHFLALEALGAGKLEEADQHTVTLLAQARTLGQKELMVESAALRATVLQQEKSYDEAIETWRGNLAEGVAPERQKQALFAIIDLNSLKGNTEQSRGLLSEFAAKNPADPAIGMVRLTLGELTMKDYYRLKSVSLTDTNLPILAKAQYDSVIGGTPDQPTLGRASLGRAWCLWEQGLIESSQPDFKRASELLPAGVDQAIARFKWADTQFALNDLPGAVTNYLALIEQYGGNAKIREGLLDQALYQLIRAGVRLGREELATSQLVQLLSWFPDRFYSENSLLLVGQALGRSGKTAEARNILEQFVQKFPNSEKTAEIALAKARLDVVDKKWDSAINIYASWLNQYTNDPARPRALFDLGWLQFKAGKEPLALLSYTNFVSEFPTNALVPQAHYWMAEHFEREKDFKQAEQHYQLVYQNTNVPPNDLSYRARLMAGRAAFSRRQYADAQGYFNWLITNGPPQVTNSTISSQLVAQAYFAYGDTFLAEPTSDPLRAFDRFGFAIDAYEMITKQFTNNTLVSMAYYKLGNCHFQYAAQEQDTNRYAKAMQNYELAIASPLVSPETRGLAELGLARVYEKLARMRGNGEIKTKLLDESITRCRNAVYGFGLKDGEETVPFVIEQAGFFAGKLLEESGRGEEAAQLYRRMAELVPSLKDLIKERLANLGFATVQKN